MQLYRPRDDRMIAGVCSGIARRFNLDEVPKPAMQRGQDRSYTGFIRSAVLTRVPVPS